MRGHQGRYENTRDSCIRKIVRLPPSRFYLQVKPRIATFADTAHDHKLHNRHEDSRQTEWLLQTFPPVFITFFFFGGGGCFAFILRESLHFPLVEINV